ncbi:MAG: formylglycine-generating enzyme family protein, partial [Planctomycetota bacterium]
MSRKSRRRPKAWGMILPAALAGILLLGGRTEGEGGPETLPKGLKAGPAKGEFTWVKDGAAMVWVEGGPFTRGTSGGSEPDEGPAVEVEVSGFFLDRFEVTNGQYRRFYAWWQAASPEERKAVSHPNEPEGHDHRPAYWPSEKKEEEAPKEGEEEAPDGVPVVGVSWFSAYAYARWAGKDLPTECEWEKASSGGGPQGKKRQWPWGDEAPDFTRCNFKGNVGRPVRTGSYALGVAVSGAHDMAGNVWEWCLD